MIQFNQGSALKFVFAENEQQVLDYAKKTFDNFKYTYKVEEVIDLTELKPTNWLPLRILTHNNKRFDDARLEACVLTAEYRCE